MREIDVGRKGAAKKTHQENAFSRYVLYNPTLLLSLALSESYSMFGDTIAQEMTILHRESLILLCD